MRNTAVENVVPNKVGTWIWDCSFKAESSLKKKNKISPILILVLR